MRISQLSTFFLLPVLLLASGIVARRALADTGHVAAVADLFEDDVLADIVLGLSEPTKQFAVEARYEVPNVRNGHRRSSATMSVVSAGDIH